MMLVLSFLPVGHPLDDCLVEVVDFILFEFVLHSCEEALETQLMLIWHDKLISILQLEALVNVLDIVPIVVKKIVFFTSNAVQVEVVENLLRVFVLKLRDAAHGRTSEILFVLHKVIFDAHFVIPPRLNFIKLFASLF